MNIDDFLFFTCIGLYIYTIGTPQFINYMMFKFYNFTNEMIKNYNDLIYSDYWIEDNDNSSITENDNQKNDPTQNPDSIILPKYEDKYLEEIRLLNKEWILSDEELQNKTSIAKEFFDSSLENLKNKIAEIDYQILSLQTDINDDSDTVNYTETLGDDEQNDYESTLEERNEWRREQILTLQNECNEIKISISTENGLNELKIKADKDAYDFIINKRIDKLKNTFVMEKTPQGNVLMIYKSDKNSFSYYSDATIPYRYLEVVARKYVKLFGCRPLFVDMEEELKLFEAKWTTEYELKKAKEAEEKLKAEESTKNNKPVEIKKNVFAKFKSYNKDAGGKISMAPPPKNSIPSKSITETKEDEKIILKERANRYTYEGKFVNFNFLQKIDKKVFNKRLGLSFADFKKTNKN